MKLLPSSQAQLFVWTDIDSAHEADFNDWYDREHMEERVAIPGMLWARRYRAQSNDVRRYLAIYRTEALATFGTDAYRAAFTHQTDWSNRNFARMINTQRRVMAVEAEAGFGAGCAALLVELAEDIDSDALTRAAAALARDGRVLRVQVMRPDAGLSTPLPSETDNPRVLRPALLADLTNCAAAAVLADDLPADLATLAHSAQAFDLIWSLDAVDLAAATHR